MIFYHHTKTENVVAILSEGLKCSISLACIWLCVNNTNWASKGASLLRVIIPDEKVVHCSYLGRGNFNGIVLELTQNIPPEWIELVSNSGEQVSTGEK